MHRVLAAVLAAASCAAGAQAQPSLAVAAGDVLTLDEALAEAGAVSPVAEAARSGLRAAQAGRVVAGLRPNPTLGVDVENAVGSGPYRGFDESETTLAFALPLELGGKRSARVAVSDAEVARARIAQAVAQADLRLDVIAAYAEAIAAERRLAVAKSQVAVTAENLRVARGRVRLGANSPIDEERARLQHIGAETGLAQTRRAAEAARAALGRYLGRPLGEALDAAWFDRTGGYGPDADPGAEGTLALALAEADVAAAEARVRLARSRRVPDLTVSAGTRRLEASGDQAMVFGVSVPLPLFDNGRAGVEQASAERDRFEAARRMALFDAEQAIAAARAERDNAASAIAASGPALDAAAEAARIARIGYAEGEFDQMVLLEAERTLLDMRRAAVEAHAVYHNAEARLARLAAPMPATTGN